jgi:hypothetical protein
MEMKMRLGRFAILLPGDYYKFMKNHKMILRFTLLLAVFITILNGLRSQNRKYPL